MYPKIYGKNQQSKYYDTGMETEMNIFARSVFFLNELLIKKIREITWRN